MATLFISFTGTMHALASGTVNVEELGKGLFYFGCTREHALTPGDGGEYVESIVNQRPDLHQTLVAALIEAESKGRVSWRVMGESCTFDAVNALLKSNGYQPLKDKEGYDSYCYPSVEDRSTEVPVIWRG